MGSSRFRLLFYCEQPTPIELGESGYMFAVSLDVADEFHPSPLIAAHGWYRRATAALRNALELMSAARAQAGEAFDSIWAEGARLAPDEAVALALTDTAQASAAARELR